MADLTISSKPATLLERYSDMTQTKMLQSAEVTMRINHRIAKKWSVVYESVLCAGWSGSSDALLGEGGSCLVYKALSTNGTPVAVKTFRTRAASNGQSLQSRFDEEVAMFKTLGVGPRAQQNLAREAEEIEELNPRQLFVNLLDFSTNGGIPGPAEDGKFYMILELGDESLDMWLRTTGFLQMGSLCEIARSLFAALEFLHGLGFVHLDVKPANIMRFGPTWKLIDLGSCLSMHAVVSPSNFTPLYASPELACAALAAMAPEGPQQSLPVLPPGLARANPAIDLWAAGVACLC